MLRTQIVISQVTNEKDVVLSKRAKFDLLIYISHTFMTYGYDAPSWHILLYVCWCNFFGEKQKVHCSHGRKMTSIFLNGWQSKISNGLTWCHCTTFKGTFTVMLTIKILENLFTPCSVGWRYQTDRWCSACVPSSLMNKDGRFVVNPSIHVSCMLGNTITRHEMHGITWEDYEWIML